MWERRLLCGYLDIDISIYIYICTTTYISSDWKSTKKGRDFQLDL